MSERQYSCPAGPLRRKWSVCTNTSSKDWRAEKHGSEGKRAELRRKTELLQERVVSTAEHEHVDTCLHSGVRGKQNITHEQDHHAQEHHGHLYLRRPPQVRTTSDSNCFHRLGRFGPQKSYCNRLGSKTTKLWVFRPILLGWAKNAHSVAFVPSTRWYQAVAVELKRRYILGLTTVFQWACTPKRKVSPWSLVAAYHSLVS